MFFLLRFIVAMTRISGDQSEGISGDSAVVGSAVAVAVIVVVGVHGCAASFDVGCFLIFLLNNIACLSRAIASGDRR